MIHLIASYGSDNFESLKRYFTVKRFNDFQEYEKYLASFNALNDIGPISVIAEEKIGETTIYNLVNKRNFQSKILNTPLLVIKDHLEGFEVEYIQKKVIHDYIPSDTNMDDLVERIRFLLMFQHDFPDHEMHEIEERERIPEAQKVLRRIIDLSFALFLLVLLSPLLILVAALIKLESRGSVFYISHRAGKGYKIFKIFKFRTMVAEADKMLDDFRDLNQYGNKEDKDVAFVKIDNDPRVTKLGTFLRKTSMDELPQLFNVVTGDMSLIGNRPLPLYEAMKLTRDYQANRFNAPAGITGLWQVKKRGKGSMSAEERINLDIEYAKNYDLFTDMKIFVQTFPALIQDSSV